MGKKKYVRFLQTFFFEKERDRLSNCECSPNLFFVINITHDELQKKKNLLNKL